MEVQNEPFFPCLMDFLLLPILVMLVLLFVHHEEVVDSEPCLLHYTGDRVWGSELHHQQTFVMVATGEHPVFGRPYALVGLGQGGQ